MVHASATFNGKVIAETDSYEFVEGNVYVRLRVIQYLLTVLTSQAVPCLFSRPVSLVKGEIDYSLPLERACILLQHYR